MVPSILVAGWADEAGLAEVSQALHTWEPHLELIASLDNTMIFEPDGTFYAVCLSDSTLRSRHRSLDVQRGDALILPLGVAIEADPGLDFVGLIHNGLPPFHFRERFIQSAGFEWVDSRKSPTSNLEAMIPWEDARYRLSYSRLRASSTPMNIVDVGLDLQLLVVTAGEGICEEADSRVSVPIKVGQVALVASGIAYRLVGDLEVTRLRLEPELVHEARRLDQASSKGSRWSPEPAPLDPRTSVEG